MKIVITLLFPLETNIFQIKSPYFQPMNKKTTYSNGDARECWGHYIYWTHPSREKPLHIRNRRPACEPAATVSAPQPVAREPVATVSVSPQASQGPEASAAQKPVAPSRNKECLLCQKQVPNLHPHVETYHLPWYFVLEPACWKCQQTAYNLSSLLERHVGCGFQGHFNDQRYLHWPESMKAFLDQLARICGYQKSTDLLLWCRNARIFPQDVVILSPTRECLLRGLDKSLGGNAEAITI